MGRWTRRWCGHASLPFDIKYKGQALLQIVLPPSPWSHSQLLSDIHSAQLWGMTPSQFRALSLDDKTDILAHDVALARMRAVEEEELRKEMEAQRKLLSAHG